MSEIRDVSAERVAAMESSSNLIDPANDRALLNYFDDVFRWHGSIRFVGVPTLRDERPMRIDSIFIEPRLTRDYVRSESNPGAIPAERLSGALAAYPRLVILGDPGTGKSTLVSWLAWQSSSPFHRKAAGWTSQVPVPVVLREIDLSSVRDGQTLLAAVLEHPSLRRLKDYEQFPVLLSKGQVLFLLDGLDEVPHGLRATLGAAIRSAFHEHERCRWLITSRVVGFEEFDLEGRSEARAAGSREERAIMQGREERRVVERRYIAPLDDEQIGGFARRWFEQREESTELAASQAREFSDALRGDVQTRQLARVASFLTLMAVIYRTQASLPHGRALLYEKIVDAYLETIEATKHLAWTVLSLAEKKRCLSYVAFQMQRGEAAATREGRREILVSGARLLELLTESIGDAKASEFLSYLRDRSGLIQQVGPDLFGFAHLSFQEYFACLYLADRITSPRWIRTGGVEPGTTLNDLRGYFLSSDWRETVVLLFETLASHSDWSDELLIELFGDDFDMRGLPDAKIAASLAVNPHSGLSTSVRQKAIRRSWEAEIAAQQDSIYKSRERGILPSLGSAQSEIRSIVWGAFSDVVKTLKPEGLSLEDCAPLPSLRSIGLPAGLRVLLLPGTDFQEIADVTFLKNLSHLSLYNTAIDDIEPIITLKKLATLDLGRTRVTDIRPLQRLPLLSSLAIDRLLVDPRELAKLVGLRDLVARDLPGDDFSFLECLRDIEFLIMSGTRIRDLRLVSHFKRLESLSVGFTNVDSLTPISSLSRLTRLDVSWTQVTSIEAVRCLPKLREVFLHNAPVADISPLFDLRHLERVGLPGSATERDVTRLRKQFPGIEIT